jgi:hypothetical protein
MNPSPIKGEGMSIQEALDQAPLQLVMPENTPQGIDLVDTRISHADDPNYDIVYLVYARSRPPEEYSLKDIVDSGGFVVIESRHSWPDSYVNQLYSKYGSDEVPHAYVKTVHNLRIILGDGGWKLEAIIYAKDEIYDIVMSPRLGMDKLDMVATSMAKQIETKQ